MTSTPVSRRSVLLGTAGLAGLSSVGLTAAPVRAATPAATPLVAADRPLLTHGVMSGDVTSSGGVVWARAQDARCTTQGGRRGRPDMCEPAVQLPVLRVRGCMQVRVGPAR